MRASIASLASADCRSISRCISDSGEPSPTPVSLPPLSRAIVHHRMPQHVHADALLGQRHGHRVDQERHVVVDDLQHGMRRFPAVILAVGIEQADVGGARLAAAREIEEIVGQCRPAVGAVQRQLVLGHASVERAGEGAGIVLARLAGALADRLEDGFEQNGLAHVSSCDARQRVSGSSMWFRARCGRWRKNRLSAGRSRGGR